MKFLPRASVVLASFATCRATSLRGEIQAKLIDAMNATERSCDDLVGALIELTAPNACTSENSTFLTEIVCSMESRELVPFMRKVKSMEGECFENVYGGFLPALTSQGREKCDQVAPIAIDLFFLQVCTEVMAEKVNDAVCDVIEHFITEGTHEIPTIEAVNAFFSGRFNASSDEAICLSTAAEGLIDFAQSVVIEGGDCESLVTTMFTRRVSNCTDPILAELSETMCQDSKIQEQGSSDNPDIETLLQALKEWMGEKEPLEGDEKIQCASAINIYLNGMNITSHSCEESIGSLVMLVASDSCSTEEAATIAALSCAMGNSTNKQVSGLLSDFMSMLERETGECFENMHDNLLPALTHQGREMCDKVAPWIIKSFFKQACSEAMAEAVNNALCDAIDHFITETPDEIPSLETVNEFFSGRFNTSSQESLCLSSTAESLIEFAQSFFLEGVECEQSVMDVFDGNLPHCVGNSLTDIASTMCQNTDIEQLGATDLPDMTAFLETMKTWLVGSSPFETEEQDACAEDMQKYLGKAMKKEEEGGSWSNMNECINTVEIYVAGYTTSCKAGATLSNSFAKTSCKIAQANLGTIAKYFDSKKVISEMQKDYPNIPQEDIKSCVENAEKWVGNVFSR